MRAGQLIFEEKKFSSIQDCKDIERCSGNIRKVFELLKANLARKVGTTKQMLMQVGGTEAAKRAREIRLGFYTQRTLKRGDVLWVRYDSSTELYWLESIKWEEWVVRHQLAQRPDTQSKFMDAPVLRAINH